ncbi:MAG: nucleotide exchange factor GrpE, partial [bacterium]
GKDPKEAVKKLKEKISRLEEEKKEYLAGWQRDKADFINARKRDEEERKEIVKYSTERLIDALIPVLESFNMAMSNKETWEKVDKNWRIGVEYIYNHFKQTLEQEGLKEIDPKGKKFDPMRDEALEYVHTHDKDL